MKTRIIRIGKSHGLRIPKRLLKQAGLSGEVEIEVRDGSLVITSARKPRAGWDEALAEMARRGDDALLEESNGNTTERLNDLYADEPSALDPALEQMQAASLPKE